MKQRVISGTIIAVITIAAILLGGIVFDLLLTFIGAYGVYEFLKSRNTKIDWIEYSIMLISIFFIYLLQERALAAILFLLFALLAYAVFNKKYSFDKACISFLETVLLGVGLSQMGIIENTNKWLFGYIVIIAYLTDVFALFTGMKFGKHKLNARVSPKKTIEGFIGGWLCGFTFSFIYALCFKFFDLDVSTILLFSLLLPIVSQIGDLIFSLIKRHFGIKDFSNLIPGHGGILDRTDSLLITLIIYRAISILLA